MVVPNLVNGAGGCPLRMLGLRASASAEEVTREWRRRMREVHPDKCEASNATERTQQLVELKERALRAVEARVERMRSAAEAREEFRNQQYGASSQVVFMFC